MDNKYLNLINTDQENGLRVSMLDGLPKKPDEEAQLQRLSAASGVPVDALRYTRPEVELQQRMDSFDYKKAIAETPALAEFFSDPANSSVAHDSWEGMGTAEKIWTKGKDYVGAIGGGVVGDAVGGTVSGFGELYGTAARSIDRGLSAILPQAAQDVLHAKVVPWFLDPEQILKRGSQPMKQVGDWMKPPVARQGLDTDVASGIGQLVGQIATYLLTGGIGAASTMYAQGADVMANKIAKDVADPALKDTAIVAGGAITAITEKYGLDKILNRVPPAIKNRTMRFLADTLAAGGIEAAQELTEGLLHDLARKTLTNSDAEVLGGVGREMTAAGISAAIVRAALGAKGYRHAQEQENVLRAALDTAADSKLRERMPEKYQSFLERVTQNGPLENIFIPAEQFKTYFQSQNMDDAAVAEKLGATNYVEAIAAGTDVVIPSASFVTQLASTDHANALLQDIRFKQGDMTSREAKLYEQNKGDGEIDLEALKLMTGADTSPASGFEDLKQQMLGELMGRFEPSTAAAYATSYAAAMSTIAQRAGVDPMELHRQFDLSVGSPLPAGLKTLADRVDVDLDPLLDRLRSGDIPAEQLAFGQSLFEFIRDAGGLQETGETKDLSAAVDRKPGKKKLVQKNGMSLDRALQAAIEAGYFPEGSQDLTESDLLDALGADLAGSRVYSAKNEDQAAASMNRTLRSLADWLDTIGADVKTMSNAQIRAIVEKSAVDGVGDVYNQSAQTDSEAFRNWFGDSKVVDAEGRPLVVYHGTGKDFAEFQEGKRQTQYGGGFYFGRDPKVASSFASPLRGPAPNVMPVYLSLQNPFIETGDYTKTPKVPKLKEQGYDGIIAQDGQIIAFYPEQIKSAIGNSGAFDPANPNILFQRTGTERGSITIQPDMRMRINLFENADLSTMLHETGHFYLEVLGELAAQPGTNQELKDDYAKIREWMGLKDGEAIKVEHHEMFARANEAYLMEGKAPNPELQSVFAKFASWLKRIYQTVKSLNVPMNAEIRGVFDRIYATDEQILAAQQEGIYAEAFATAEDAGMTEAEFKAYRKQAATAIENGKAKLRAKLMKAMLAEETAQRRAARKAMREKVEAEVNAEPVYVAMDVLAAGKTADGEPIKLSKKLLVKQYGNEFVTKSIPKVGGNALYTEDGGSDLDTVAEVLGFDSGRLMLDQLVNAQPKKALIESITDERMREQYPDPLTDGTIAEKADEALHNATREDLLKLELRLIRKKASDFEAVRRAKEVEANKEQRAGEKMVKESLPRTERVGRTPGGGTFSYQVFDPEPMKRAAAGMMAQKRVRDVSPNSYLMAERRAALAFADAMKAKDFQLAASLKQKELFNHYLYKEAVSVREEMDSAVNYLKKQGATKNLQRLGKAGSDYLEQVQDILERYELKDVSLARLNKRQSLLAWVNEQEAAGNAVSIPEEVLNEARRVNWRDVPVEELRGVRDSVKNIEHLARMKNTLLTKKGKQDFQSAINELVTAVEESGFKSTGELSTLNRREMGLLEKGARFWRKMDANLLKMEQVVEWLDGGKIDGPWRRLFWDLADQAQTKEYDLHRQVTMALNELRKSMPDAWNAGLDEKAGFEMTIRTANGAETVAPSRYTMLSIALNMGNAQNMQRLRDGNGISDAQMMNIRNSMTDADWQFVQGVWDAVELLWPDMAAMEKRVSGLAPTKVEAQSFDVNGKVYRGGYFPIVYDSRLSATGEKQADADATVQAFLSAGAGRPTTNKGATKTRQDVVNSPLMLDFNQVLGGHVAKVVKDISHREAVQDMYKILSNDQLKQTLIDRLGMDRYTEMKNFVKALVIDRADILNAAAGIGSIAMKARTNLSIVTMGFKASTAFSQFAGYGPSRDFVKGRFLFNGALKAWKLGSQDRAENFAMMYEKSGEMRHRAETLDRDLRDALRRISEKRSAVAEVQRTAFYFTALADKQVSGATWLGAYEQSLAEGMTDENAVAYADKAVRMSQGSGGAKDLAAVQRDNEFMRLVTMFYTPFSVLYSRLRDIGHQTAVQGIGYLPTAVARSLWLVAMPAVLGQLMAGRGPDDDEDKVWWSIRQMLMYPMATVPILRDFAGVSEQLLINVSGEGKMDFAPSYQLSPIASAMTKAWNNLVANPVKWAVGDKEFDDKMGWGMVESSGLIFGLPTAQVSITGSYLLDLLNGDADPENALDILKDALFKRKKEK